MSSQPSKMKQKQSEQFNSNNQPCKMKQKQSEQFNSNNLPDDVVFDIFTWLPVKTLIRLMCVSKWKSKITSTDFRNKQLNNQAKSITNNDNNGFLLYQSGKRLYTSEYNSNHTLNRISTCRTPGELICYYNGIFCIKRITYTYAVDRDPEEQKLYLWNSSLRETFSKMIYLGSFNGSSQSIFFGLAYSHQKNEFKVLGISFENSEKAILFTLNARGVTKRTIETWLESLGRTVSYLSETANPLLFFNGALHCLARCTYPADTKELILSFDANDETFREIELPKSYRQDFGSTEDLVVFQGSLTLITYNEFFEEFNIRVMEEYGNVDSWTNMVVRLRTKRNPEKFKKVYGCTKNGELLCAKEVCLAPGLSYKRLVSFDLETKELRELGISTPESLNYTITVFESLLFCI